MSRRTVDALKLPRWVDPKAAGAAGGSGAPAAEPHVLWEKVDGSPFPFDAKINSSWRSGKETSAPSKSKPL